MGDAITYWTCVTSIVTYKSVFMTEKLQEKQNNKYLFGVSTLKVDTSNNIKVFDKLLVTYHK